jgi:hypothetical protein
MAPLVTSANPPTFERPESRLISADLPPGSPGNAEGGKTKTSPRGDAANAPEKMTENKAVPKRLLKGRFLVISILFHVMLALVATYLVVQTFTPRAQTFKAGPPAPHNKEVEHKITMVKKQNTMSAPMQTKRIATTGLSKVALPEMPDISSVDPTTPTAMAGMGTPGAGFGTGGMAGGTGATDGGSPFFGLRDSGAGLEGTFYDFKRVSKDRALDRIPPFDQIVNRFTTGTWGPKSFKNYRSPVKLYGKAFLFPAIRDTEAGKAFQSPETAPGGWLAHYVGTIVPPEDGAYRFVGFGDNVMIVKLDSSLVLDASDHGYTKRRREEAGGVSFPAKPGTTPIFFGSWFSLQKGAAKRMEVVVGDEGGIFCAGLFLQKQGVKYEQGAQGIPKLPLFMIGRLSEAQKTAFRQYVPDSAFAGPFFSMKAAGGLPGGL